MPEKKIFVLPLAAEPAWLMAPPAPREPVFLYVGQISLRKGVHRLLIAWKRLKAHRTHRLRLIGSMRLSDSFLKDFSDVYEHVPVVPRDRLAAYYTRAQALLFNALADGFGMVVTEAMSCGTPILASQNAGASMLVTDLHEGRLFPYGDDDALMTALDWALSHPAELAEMGSLARRKAAEWTWPDYRTAFGEWVQRVQRDAA
jgi:glycosyltransferase involved in cell wall biosynthesis